MSEEYREYAEIVHLVWPDWEVVEKIGSGAFATVVRASRKNKIAGEKDSAVKIIRIPGDDSDWDQMLAEGKNEEQAEQYFQSIVDDSLKEIRAMEDLTGNTNIVSIFDYKVHQIPDRHVWYILIRMEYLRKVDTSALDESEIIRMGVDVCTALSICRKKNIVHRDVSLDNVFIHDGNYKLGDFGVAKVLEGTTGSMHSIAGKPLYMAPEVYNATLAETDIDSAAKVDIYSLGILLYRLSNNMKYPFEDPDKENITAKERNQAFKRRVIEGEALPAPKNASPEFSAIILKACMASPSRRYDSADAMKADLLALAKDREPEPVRPLRQKLLWILPVLALLAGLVYFLFLRPARVSEWSDWSAWSKAGREITEADRMQEESRERYEWKALQCPSCGENNLPDAKICVNTECGAPLYRARTVYAYSDDTVSEVIYGQDLGRYFDGKPYWFNGSVRQYRYRAKGEKVETDEEYICHDWYFSTYEDSEDYPGIVFTADGADQYFSVYTNGERLILADNRYDNSTPSKEAVFENGILSAGFEEFALENGKLVRRYGPVTEVYTRQPQERRIPAEVSYYYAKALKPEHYNGTWIITQYGVNNAFINAEEMNLSGKAVIEDGKMTLTWTRDGQEKSIERTFDAELNDGRLYTLVNGATSFIVSMLQDHCIMYNAGLNEAQWVMRKEHVVDESAVNLELPEFEETFQAKKDWTVSEETRNELASLLLNTAVANGLDPASVNTDGPFYLLLVSKESGFPLLVCEGTGEYADCMLSVGRGVSLETKKPFVYYRWSDEFYTGLLHPEKDIVEYQKENVLSVVAGDQIWPVRVELK